MKKCVRMVWLVLLVGLLPGMLITARSESAPSGELAGGQLDDTGRSDLAEWLVHLNGGDALPDAGGKEVLAATIVENARSLVGKYPYVYGGESPEEGGFDCTGLVWYVYNQMSGLDITLSQAGRSKAALAAAGENIYDHDQFLPGDVIQFTYAHVAIYVGDGRVVHARTTGTMIQETDLNYNNVEYAVRYPGVVQSTVLASGSCGDGVSWLLRTNGALGITGAGAMTDYSEDTDVPWYAYRERIESVVMEETVTSVGDYAFYGCAALESVSAPGVSSVGIAAFYDCGALREAVLANRVTEIGAWAFCRCAKLGQLSLSEGLVSIGSGAFYGCSALAGITLPEGLTRIADSAFENCSALVSIAIPEGVTTIGESAFFGCLSLETVDIPKTVTEIGDWAFAYCDAMDQVVYSGFSAGWEEIVIGTNNEPLRSAQLVSTGVPDAPEVKLSGGNGIVLLSWEAVRYAEKYEIWRMRENGRYEWLGETTATAFVDNTVSIGVTHFYIVRAVAEGRTGNFGRIHAFMEIQQIVGVLPRL